MSNRKGPVKPVFLNDVELDSFYITEGLNSSCTPSGQQAEIGKIIDKYTLLEDVEKQEEEQKQEEQKKRINGLRSQLNYLDSTVWMFQNNKPFNK
jgi:hypothetical protein